ncbi:MAG: VCBS repeat-containing protein, partial [Chloroflexi bacterium]|nr:VCBS repeat-containing protein [Chloroflexota bacterium]
MAAAAGQVLTTVTPGALLGRGTADLDADGRLDLVQLVAGADDTVSVQVMAATGAGLAPARTWWTSAAGQFTGQLSLVTGDFSGDGRGDAGILERDPSRTKLWLLTSTGTAFAWQSWRLSVARDLTAAVAVAGDFSGDGRDDVAFLVPDGPPEAPTATVIEVAASGKVDTRGVTTLYLRDPAPWSTEPAPPATIKAVAGDIDRTGRDDLLLLRKVSGDAVRVL